MQPLTETMNNEDIWAQVKFNLITKNSENKPLQTWFNPTDLVAIEQTPQGRRFKLGVPTELHKYWISENLFDRICSEISSLFKQPFQLELVVTGKTIPVPPESPGALHQAMSLKEHPQEPSIPLVAPYEGRKNGDFLNPEYTFSSFVVGRNNEFAHATSYRIAQRPGSEGYNPLFICGPTGMGKTHLLHAVGNENFIYFC
jgi:chromosomal replication initiator protein